MKYKPVTGKQILYDSTYMKIPHLYEVSKIVKFIESESIMVIARGWGKEEIGVTN